MKKNRDKLKDLLGYIDTRGIYRDYDHIIDEFFEAYPIHNDEDK